MPLLSCYFHGHGSEEEYVVCTSHRVIEFEGQFELAPVEFAVYGFDPEAAGVTYVGNPLQGLEFE